MGVVCDNKYKYTKNTYEIKGYPSGFCIANIKMNTTFW